MVRGDGVAALCCAHLLRKAGFCVAMERPDRVRIPAVLLSDAALALIRDVFERPDLFISASRIDRRIVCWGKGAEVIEVPHSAAVVSEARLVEELGRVFEPDTPSIADFTILASKPLPAITEEHRFGARTAMAAEVALKDTADSSSCWVESLEDGWLFLIPNASASNWVLGIGARVESLLASSRVIAPRIDLLPARLGEFPAFPRLIAPLAGTGWIACGTPAIAFDPLCGDGTAQSVREAILASAVICGIAGGKDAPSLFAHYETRLIRAMLRHLELCAQFYRDGVNGPWWKAELEALGEGQRWCAASLKDAGEPRYRLNGFVLEPIDAIYNRSE